MRGGPGGEGVESHFGGALGPPPAAGSAGLYLDNGNVGLARPTNMQISINVIQD